MKAARILALLVLAQCDYAKRDVCKDDLCIGNNPPVAVIAHAESGTLRIGASGAVTLDAKGSSDPDGDTITYAWATTCAGTGAADGTTYVMAGIAEDCAATLTVTDSHGASALATVAIHRANIDAYVSNTSCLTTYDHESGGTADQPFCTLALALEATLDVAVDAVKLDTHVHSVTSSFVISQDVTIRGGYDRANGWAQGSGITSISFTIDPAFPNSGFVMEGGSTVRLEDLELYFSSACPDNCALVTGLDTELTLENVTTGTTTRTNAARPVVNALGHTYASVYMAAPGNTTPELHVSNSHFNGATVADLSASVVVLGAVDTTIEDSTIDEHGVTALGVFTRDAGATVVRRTVITMDGGGTHNAVGVWDGLQNDVAFPDTDTCPQAAPCQSSKSLHIDESQVTITNAFAAYAVVSLGTESLLVEGTSTVLSVQAQGAVGVLTSAVGTAKVSNTAFSIVPLPLSAMAYAVGYSDNFAGDGTFDGAPGSQSVTIENSTIDIAATASLVGAIYGINLVATMAAVVNDTTLTLSSTATTQPVYQMTGLRTQRVGRLGSTRLGVSIDGQVQHAAFAITDGDYNQSLEAPVLAQASSNLVSLDPLLHVHVVARDSDSIVAGGAFFGTQGLTLRGTSATATNVEVIAESTVNALGVVTLKTANPVIEGLGFRVERIEGAMNTDNGAIGIADGNPNLTSSTQDSTNLSVLRNRIDTNGHGDFSADVFVTGASQGVPVIADNFMTTSGSGRAFGVIFVGVGGTVRFNTFRLVCGATTSCTAVSSAYNVGADVRVLGNTLTVRRATITAPASYATLVAECNASSSARTVDRIAWNLYHCDTDKMYDGDGKISIYRAGTCTGVTQDASTLTAVAPSVSVASSNQDELPALFCSDTTWHGAPGSPQIRYVNEAFTTENDIDGDSRSGSPPYDAGADVISSSCP